MPIDYNKYPPNWKTEIRPRILKRAEHRCETCGVENYSYIRRHKDDGAIYVPEGQVHICILGGDTEESFDQFYHKPIKIILTVAHLDHDPENWEVSDDRLKALCQRCHLNYDREKK